MTNLITPAPVLMPNLLLIARSTVASYETPTRINRRAILADRLTIEAKARTFWAAYLPTTAAQAAAGNTNAVNTHKVRIELA